MKQYFIKHKDFFNYLKRFTLVHVITYLVCGMIFINLMNYQREFLTNQSFAHFRPLNSPIVQAAVLFQFLRGALFAVILYPFREKIIGSKSGWLILFGVLWGLTALGAVNASPGSIEGLIYTDISLKASFVGMPEVIVQAMSFSVLFWLWERKRSILHKV